MEEVAIDRSRKGGDQVQVLFEVVKDGFNF